MTCRTANINATTTFEGTYYLTADGTVEKPIVIKAAGDGEVIIDGRGNFNLFNLKAADYHYFEGITFKNTDIAIWAGTQFIARSKGLTVKRCRFEQVGMGVFPNYSGSSNFYIADSVFLGRNDPKHLTGWNGAFWEQFNGVEGQIFPPIMASYTASGSTAEATSSRTTTWRIFTTVSTRNVRHARRLARARRSRASTARVLGSAAGRDRHLQQLHHQRTRQPSRLRPPRARPRTRTGAIT